VDEALVGFAALPSDNTPELVGAVHPAYRRRGIGRQLLVAARAETRRRGRAYLILVCEVASPAGLSFALASDARLDSAEFQMELPRGEFAGTSPDDAVLQLIPAQREDTALLTQIGNEAFGSSPSTTQERLQRWFNDPTIRFYLGRVGGIAVGSLRTVRKPGDPIAYIYGFGIRRAHWRLGHGRRLLTAALATLFGEGCETVRLEVETTNDPAVALYHSCGFRAITEYRYYQLQP
jgi:mycothiol synthase